ncbi:MAG: TlpA disulfide reductase family protein [Limnohabitans sp.]|nr:TlpA disulfide reductase family protein [Limnohabitans sp.]
MKKILLLGLLVVSQFGISQIKLQFTAKNAPSDKITIGNRATKKEFTGKDGVYKIELGTDAADGFYQLQLGEQFTQLYLTKDNDLKATLDYKDFDKTLKYTGKGAKENNYLAKRLAERNEKDFESIINASDEASINTEVNKLKEKVFGGIPKDLNTKFVDEFKKISEMEFAGLTNYVKKSLGNKKLNGQIAPGFNYENHKGGTTKLEDLRGKYVYIDVWATWCGPCRAEIPSLKKTEEAFHGKNIEFVSLSIDAMKDHDKWKNFVTEKQLGGIQLMADKDWNSDFTVAFGIQSIPRFILIGPDGKVVNADAPRPSSPELANLLNSVVK